MRIQYTDRDRRARIPECIPSTDGTRSVEVLDGEMKGNIFVKLVGSFIK